MGTFDRQVKSVKRLIDKYGQLVTFKSTTLLNANTNKPWELTNGTPAQKDIKVIFLSPSSNGESFLGRELLQYLTGTSVASGKIRGYCAAFEYEPKLNDIITRDSNELTIKAVDTLSPNGQVLMHVLEFDV